MRWSRFVPIAWGWKLKQTPLREKLDHPLLKNMTSRVRYTQEGSARSGQDLRAETGGSTPSRSDAQERGSLTHPPRSFASTRQCQNAPKVH